MLGERKVKSFIFELKGLQLSSAKPTFVQPFFVSGKLLDIRAQWLIDRIEKPPSGTKTFPAMLKDVLDDR